MTREPTRDEVALLETILGTTGDWMLCKDVAIHPLWREANPDMSLTNSERVVRAIASASKGSVISFPGAPGYKLAICSTVEERRMAVAKLRHQSAMMHARATEIEQWNSQQEQLQLV